MILSFRSRSSYVFADTASYEAHSFSTVLSREELLRIRKLSARDFEVAFENQLRTEKREALLSISYMKEAYKRRDWSVSYSSFKRYCVDKMKMSDTDFYRKFSIMRTLSEIPELEEKILEGSLNQATVCKTIQFIHKESRSRSVPTQEKRELFAHLENKTEKEVERELATLSPESAIPDRTRQISADGFHRQFTSDQALEDKLARIKELLAHSFQGQPSDCEFFHKLADLVLEKIDPEIRDARKLKQERARDDAQLEKQAGDEAFNGTAHADLETRRLTKLGKNRVTRVAPRRPSAAVLRRVRIRDQYCCTHVDPVTGRRCRSRYAVEPDHIVPFADGGSNEPENLRLVCRTHNQLYALKRFGRLKMQSYMSSLRS